MEDIKCCLQTNLFHVEHIRVVFYAKHQDKFYIVLPVFEQRQIYLVDDKA